MATIAATTQAIRGTRGILSRGSAGVGIVSRGHEMAGTVSLGHGIAGMLSCGGAETRGGRARARARRAPRRLRTSGLAASFWPVHSSGVRQRSHQILIPRLGWPQVGHGTDVPTAFGFEPSFSISRGGPQVRMVEEPERIGGVLDGEPRSQRLQLPQ